MRNGTDKDEEARFLSQGLAMLNLVDVLASLLVRKSVPKIGGVARIDLVEVEVAVLREFFKVMISADSGCGKEQRIVSAVVPNDQGYGGEETKMHGMAHSQFVPREIIGPSRHTGVTVFLPDFFAQRLSWYRLDPYIP